MTNKLPIPSSVFRIPYSVSGLSRNTGHRIPDTEYRRRAAASAFTLVEVIAAITILAMITGSVYALMRQSFQAAADLQQVEREDAATRRFLALCRATLENLPGDATLSLATAEETGTAQELTLSGVPEAFSVGAEPVASSDLIIGLRMPESEKTSNTATPLYQVSISREEFAPKAKDGEFQLRATSDDDFYQPDDQGRYWLPLLTDIRSLEWRYWNETDKIWEDDWSQAPSRPTLLEMQLWPETRPAPLRAVFTLPPAASATATADSQAAATAATSGAGSTEGGRGARMPGARDGEGRGPGRHGAKGEGGKRPPEGERGRHGRGNRSSGNRGPDVSRDRAPRNERGSSGGSNNRAGPGSVMPAPVIRTR